MISERNNLESRGVSSIERRKHTRYSFTAAAEVVEMHSTARIQGRLSDLGRGGCYIDTINPFNVGSEVKMPIVNENRRFIAQAKVVFAAAGMGMGLMFTAIDPAQLLVLEKWLAEWSEEAR